MDYRREITIRSVASKTSARARDRRERSILADILTHWAKPTTRFEEYRCSGPEEASCGKVALDFIVRHPCRYIDGVSQDSVASWAVS